MTRFRALRLVLWLAAATLNRAKRYGDRGRCRRAPLAPVTVRRPGDPAQRMARWGVFFLGCTHMPGYFDLNRNVALVTGASRGLGLAMTEALPDVGATAILNCRYANTLKIAADRMRDSRP